MIKFPDILPSPQISTNEIKHVSPFSRSQMISGRTRQRKEFDKTISNTVFSFVFSADEVLVFEDWYENSINSGQDWFTIKRLTAGGIQDVQARFTSMYQGANPMGLSGFWSVSFNAEIRDYFVLDGDWWKFPEWVIDDCGNKNCILDCVVNNFWVRDKGFDDVYDRIDYIVNEVMYEK